MPYTAAVVLLAIAALLLLPAAAPATVRPLPPSTLHYLGGIRRCQSTTLGAQDVDPGMGRCGESSWSFSASIRAPSPNGRLVEHGQTFCSLLTTSETHSALLDSTT